MKPRSSLLLSLALALALRLVTVSLTARQRPTLLGECEPYREGGCRTCADCTRCRHCHVEKGECSVCGPKR